ncbi:MAG: methyltransferase [Candidatus ainarchaeum sp.]|nr:methyltransferase [Candidatus ainarchaeum sp.]MDD3976244.1 methyltransferase [Candidatus ainarchaeum sp.]
MNDLNYKDFYLSLPKNIYEPSDDSFLFLEVLKKKISKTYLDVLEIGPGSGILSFFLSYFSKNLILADIDLNVINYLKSFITKYNLENVTIIYSDLFSNINKNLKFDLIVFNPPYVPSNTKTIICDDGGKNGSEIILDFINNLNIFLKDNGNCYLLVSTLNNIDNIKKNIIKNNLKYFQVAEKKLFFEKLIVFEIRK